MEQADNTVLDVARKLNCSPRGVYRLIKSGQLRAYTVNARGDLRIRDEWVAAFVEARSLTTATEPSDTQPNDS